MTLNGGVFISENNTINRKNMLIVDLRMKNTRRERVTVVLKTNIFF